MCVCVCVHVRVRKCECERERESSWVWLKSKCDSDSQCSGIFHLKQQQALRLVVLGERETKRMNLCMSRYEIARVCMGVCACVQV